MCYLIIIITIIMMNISMGLVPRQIEGTLRYTKG